LIEIRGPEGLADELVTVRIPIDIEEDEFAMAFRYDPVLEGMLSGMSILDSDQGWVAAVIRIVENISVVVSAIRAESLERDVETPFKHGVHDWHIPNFGSYPSPKGVCAGWSLSAMYYFFENLGPALYGRFDNYDNAYVETPGLWKDDEQAMRLVSVAQASIDWDGFSNRFWHAYRRLLSEEKVYRALAYTMLQTEEPQFVGLRGKRIDGTSAGHAVICYRKEGDTFFISDPKFPKGQGEAAQEQSITYYSINSEFGTYSTPATDEEMAAQYDAVYYIGYRDLLDWPELGQLWDELRSGTVGNSEFPTYSLMISEEGKDREEVLQTNHRTSSKKVDVHARSSGFKPYLVLRGSDLKPFASGTGKLPIELDEGENYIGFEIYHEQDDQPNLWVAFDWIKINYEAPEVVEPASIDLCDLLPPGGEGVRPADFHCSQSYAHSGGLSSVQVLRIAGGSERACQQWEESAFNTVIRKMDVGDCGYLSAYTDPDSGKVMTGDGAAWSAFFAVGDFRVLVNSGTGAAHPARSDWVMGKVAEVQELLREVAGVDS
ncbi:MAG: hypothetical protein JSW37_09895, partial [Anaerolineales bacterium]